MQNTHILQTIPALHRALLVITGLMNNPQQDEAILQAAGLPLDRALFPLLVRIERQGPIGVVDLADLVGRDHTTVSRQVAKLAELGLIARQGSALDRRLREAVISPKGKAMTDLIDAERTRLALTLFADWSEGELSDLARLAEKLASAAAALSAKRKASAPLRRIET
ncbi:MAG: MarR family winged helix-turn-helix transcriptional regulator [Tabrizicola sp.]